MKKIKKAIITGSSGFIGRVLQLKLREAGYYVIGFDLDDSHTQFCNEFYQCSYAQIGKEKYETLLQDVDAIFHLGANSLLGPSVNDPLTYYQNNVSEMATMLKNLVAEWWGGAFIFASSAATYGDVSVQMPLFEDLAGSTINPYGSTKLVGEMMLRESCHAYGLKAYAMRFFNVAGAYKGLGQAPNQPHILTRMSMGLEKEETFYINGDDYQTNDGTCVRDYIHVSDVCDALIAAAWDLSNKPTHTYDDFNVCSGVGVSNKELAEQFSELYPFRYDYKPSRPGDPAHLVGNPGKMNRELGVFAEKSLKDIILSHHGYIKQENKTITDRAVDATIASNFAKIAFPAQAWRKTYEGEWINE